MAKLSDRQREALAKIAAGGCVWTLEVEHQIGASVFDAAGKRIHTFTVEALEGKELIDPVSRVIRFGDRLPVTLTRAGHAAAEGLTDPR